MVCSFLFTSCKTIVFISSFSIFQNVFFLSKLLLLHLVMIDVSNFCFYIKSGENHVIKSRYQVFSRAIGNNSGGQSDWPFGFFFFFFFFFYIKFHKFTTYLSTKQTLTLHYYTNDTPGSNVLVYPGAKNT